MNGWIDSFNLSIAVAALLLSVMGLWFTSVIPGIDRWSRHFFMGSFIIFLLCCLSGVLEMAFQSYIVPSAVFQLLLLLESLLLSLLLPMLTVYLLHCCGEDMRSSKLLRAVLGMWAASYALFVSAFLFFDGFFFITPENRYYRGPLYPFLLLPLVTLPLLNLAGTIKRRKRLSHKTFLAFLITILPIAVALIPFDLIGQDQAVQGQCGDDVADLNKRVEIDEQMHGQRDRDRQYGDEKSEKRFVGKSFPALYRPREIEQRNHDSRYQEKRI